MLSELRCLNSAEIVARHSDYMSSVSLDLPGDQMPTHKFFGAWADSRLGCTLIGAPNNAIHQHTMGAVVQ